MGSLSEAVARAARIQATKEWESKRQHELDELWEQLCPECQKVVREILEHIF